MLKNRGLASKQAGGDTGHKGVVQRHKTHPLFKTKKKASQVNHTHIKEKKPSPPHKTECPVPRAKTAPKRGDVGLQPAGPQLGVKLRLLQ